jgi:hypothetical protein
LVESVFRSANSKRWGEMSCLKRVPPVKCVTNVKAVSRDA